MKIGMTLAILRAEGKIPVVRDKLKIWARGLEIQGMTRFTIEGLILSAPALLPFLNFLTMSRISDSSIGLRNMVLGWGLFRKSEKDTKDWILEASFGPILTK